MKIGTKPGDKGASVERLHRILAVAGLAVESSEDRQHEFGPSTLAALHEFQHRNGIPERDEVDAATISVLIEIEPPPSNPSGAAEPRPPDPHRGHVKGSLVDEDGAPVAGARVELFAQQVRTESRLAEAVTGRQGQFSLSYHRPAALNLLVRAYNDSSQVAAQSATSFAAAATLTINLTTAPSGKVAAPSLLTKVTQAVNAQLGAVALTDLQENAKQHELQFLANAAGFPFGAVADLYIATALGGKNGVRTATFFGILYQGIPVSLGAALASLPDNGMDAAFLAQVLQGVLAHSRDSLSQALTAATAGNTLPASYSAAQDAELAILDQLRANNVSGQPYVRGKTALSDLLSAGGIAAAVQTAFVQAYADSSGQIGPAWKTLRANPNLSKAELDSLNATLSLGELLTGNLPLVKDTLARLSNKSLASVQALALLDENDWIARITELDPQAASIPQVLPNDTAQQRIARFAKALAGRFAGRYSTTAFAGALSKANASSFAATQAELAGFLNAHPTVSLKHTNIDAYLAANKAALSPAALKDMKTAQRLFRVSPHYASVEALKSAGYLSAQQIYFAGRGPFQQQMTKAMGSASLAGMAYARAQMTYATALAAYGRYNLAFSGVTTAAAASAAPSAAALDNLPDLQALFGTLDYFQCESCQSVYSPAAYLVDLLQYLYGFSATGVNATNARDALFLRRPEIQYLALSCNNTEITLPYIDLVNEILESAIAPPQPAVTFIDTSGTSQERRALPQQLSAPAYALTANAVFPLSLPFDLAFAQTTAYIAALKTTRGSLIALLGGNPPSPAVAASLAAAALQINPAMQSVIDGSDTHQPWERWGLAQNPGSVIDPLTRAPYAPNPADWVAALSKVPLLLNRSGLSLQQLYQLLECVWVTQGSVSLAVGTSGPLQTVDPSTDDMVFTGLTDAALDRANRFLRLWSASNLKMWELDWALAPGGALNDAFLVFLNGAKAVAAQLKLPFQEALSFWLPLETRDVTDHLGPEDSVAGSTYGEIFRNAAVLAGAAGVFVPLNPIQVVAATNAPPIAITTVAAHGYQTGMQVAVANVQGNPAANGNFTITVTGANTFTLDGSAGNGVYTSGGSVAGLLSGNAIVAPAAPPTAELNAVTAALGLTADEISAILSFSGAPNTLSTGTLNVLLQYQRLAAALALQVPDLILWIQLTSLNPFQASPAGTLEFCRRLAVLQATALSVYDIDYLLRGQSAGRSLLAFTPAATTALLQTVRDAIAKLPAISTIPVAGVTNAPAITISTAQPNGLQTDMQVTISGVGGNDAANGTFTITVLTPTSFQLNGTNGNSAWTGGGAIAVAAWDASTLQTILVDALTTATRATANVVTPLLLSTGILPFSADTVSQLVAQTSGVDPAAFPALVQALTAVVKGAALYTAVKPSESDFAFAIANAAAFQWLNPGALPASPIGVSPYAATEALFSAFQLSQRQPARYPKLFDILGGWLPPNPLPPDTATAIAGPTLAISGVSNGSPIVITTTSPHGFETGAQVTISNVGGNTGANGQFSVTVSGLSTFSLDGSVSTAAWTGGGSVAVPGLAAALNASVNDVNAIAASMGATAPSLAPATQPGSLADMAMLTAIAKVLDAAAPLGSSGAGLVQLAALPATASSAAAARGVLQSQYAQSDWLAAIQPVEDSLRAARRDALVSYLLAFGPAAPAPAFLTTDDIFNYYLIDPEMCPCASMTRLLQAALAIQQFVSQCFLNLSIAGLGVDMSNPLWQEWPWRQQFASWQCNRRVFLYPENFLLPELRADASPFFSDLTDQLRQTNCDEDAAEAAIESYLRSLLGVARLQVVAHYNQTNPDGSVVLHVFARTHGTPPQWWYRARTGLSPGTGSWSAWVPLNLDITSDHLLPVIWDRRLHLVWAVFKQVTEKQSDQGVPPNGGGDSSAPQNYWTVEFSMSELSAGQWQAKSTYDQKLFFLKTTQVNQLLIDRPPRSFTFQAAQDSGFNLRIAAYYSQTPAEVLFAILFGGNTQATLQLAQAGLPMPDAALAAIQTPFLFPAAALIDLSQEPSYALVQPGTLNGALTAPANYGFSAQSMVAGSYNSVTDSFLQNTGSAALYVLCQSTPTGQPVNVKLLNTVVCSTIVPPQQEPVFDSADPFFVADPTRTYLVQPEYFTVSSSPLEVASPGYLSQWSTQYAFETFYHPYARTFLRELEIGGVPQLMARNLQVNPQAVRNWNTIFNFQTIYQPQPPVVKPYPGAAGASDPGETALDFSGACAAPYALYNWEVFYHIPMFVASLLLQNQQFQPALNWLKYIFNPTDNSGGTAPQRYWQTAPLYEMNAADWINQQIQSILSTLAVDTQQGINDPSAAAAIQNWIQNPYDADAVATLRVSAYGKATVMKTLDVLIAWGDWYYAKYTAENVSQAEQLYIMADMILGPKPQAMRLPVSSQGGAGKQTYASLQNIDEFSNALVNVENLIVAPEPPQSVVQGTANTQSLPLLPGQPTGLLFCIPPNHKLLAYWDTVARRLYNIRHCLNLQGQPQPLPLYGPQGNAFNLGTPGAGGAGADSAAQAAPIYRFTVYVQKAADLASDVRNYGALILSALEKQDSEGLAVLRANQELDIQTRMLDVKNTEVTEAQDQITVLNNQRAVTQIRYNFYSTVVFMNPSEVSAFALQASALIANEAAVVLDATAGYLHFLPTLEFGVSGFGGTPTTTVTFGGENVASSVASYAGVARGIGGIFSERGGMAATMASYQRRMDDWNLQAQLAQAELTQIDSQIAAANDRLSIAQIELAIQQEQIRNAQAVSSFLTGKFTNAQLYSWMVTQLVTVYTQAYQLAFSLALQAQNAYRYELGTQDSFVQFGYWDSQYKGLTAGESLLFDLRRMEAQHLAANSREQELIKHIPLALKLPMALVMLRQTGTCQIALDEALFESDHPGQYFRRLRSVALTFPCVTGPYTGLNATLTLTGAMVRTQAPAASYQPQGAGQPPNDPSVIVSPAAPAGAATISTSSGQNDAGLFELNLRDERWLPFEGQGAISTWNLVLDPRDNNFDFTTLTDVVLHIRYTARGGDQAAANIVRSALKPATPRSIFVSTRYTFGSAFYGFFHPADPAATNQVLTLPFNAVLFPYSNLGTGIKIQNVAFYVSLTEAPAGGITMAGTVGFGAGVPQPLTLAPAAGQTSDGSPIQALTASAALSTSTPDALTLTIPTANIPASLAVTANGMTRLDPSKIEDLLLIVEYTIQ